MVRRGDQVRGGRERSKVLHKLSLISGLALGVFVLAGGVVAASPIGHAAGIGPFAAAPAAVAMPVIDRPEIRSYKPYSTLQFGFRPQPPIQRGVRTTRPRIVMPKRVTPLLDDDGYSGQGYSYCADAPGAIEPREGPYGPAPIGPGECP